MKILVLVASHGEGGLEKHCVELCNGLQRAGNRVIFVGHPDYQNSLHSDISFESLDLTRSRYNLNSLWSLHRVITRHQPDIVHAQANKAGFMLATLAKLTPGKKVFTVHGFKKRLPANSAYDAMIAVSHKAAERVSHPNTQVIYNGIAPYCGPCYSKEELCKELQLDSNKLIFAAIGRLSPVKRFDRLIDAWPAIDANLLIIGDGELRNKLESQASTLAQLGKIKFLGHRTDVPALLHAIDACIFSSEREGFPYVFVESLLSKTPVIGTAVSDFPRILPQENLCQPTGEGLKPLLLNWVKNYSSLSSQQTQIYSFAEQNLLVDAMVNRHCELYSQLLKREDAPVVEAKTD